MKYDNPIQEIEVLFRAALPYIWVLTYEEDRFIRKLYEDITHPSNIQLWTWSNYTGAHIFTPGQLPEPQSAKGPMAETWKPITLLQKIATYQPPKSVDGAIFVLKDFHHHMAHPIPRILRDLYSVLQNNWCSVIIVSPSLQHGPGGTQDGITPTLEKQINVVEFGLPDSKTIRNHVSTFINDLNTSYAKLDSSGKQYTEKQIDTFTTALQGLTSIEIETALSTSVCHLNRIDEKKLISEKKQIIQKSDVLEYVETETELSDIGGFDAAKSYITSYQEQFSQKAQEFGVEPVKGIILSGVPGTGKSTLARAIATHWNLPLLRLDVGKVMAGIVGQSESRMRHVITLAEAVAPCVLWVEEIEKSLSGTKSSGRTDGGTLMRVFGTLLTAMEERMKGVITVATSNDITNLPPELIRRFNEVFFVDLPFEHEREDIFKIHLTKRKRNPDKFDIAKLSEKTQGFTGAEIEKVIKESIAYAFNKQMKDINDKVILQKISDTKPISTVMKEKIDEIRGWAQDRARYASTQPETEVKMSKPKAARLRTPETVN